MANHKVFFSATTFVPLELKHRVIMAPLTRHDYLYLAAEWHNRNRTIRAGDLDLFGFR